MPRLTRPVPRIGRFPLVAVLSLIAVVGTTTLSFASLVVGVYIPIVAVRVGGVLTFLIPLAAGVLAVLRYTRFPRLRPAGFTPQQMMIVASAAALLGWLNVAWAGAVGVLGAVLSALWLLMVCSGRLVPALRWSDAERPAAPSDTANIFPAASAPRADAATVSTPTSSWVLVPAERDVVDDNGIVVFTVGPTAWALVVGETPTTLRLRDFSGREGTLTDVTGVIRN